jgi:polysaccharide transporter, PST family
LEISKKTNFSFIKSSFWTTLASLAFGINSFIVNKLFSVYFGPQGVTLLAHFQNVIAIFTTLPNEGINRGVLKFFSASDLSTENWNKYLSGVIFLNIVCYIFTLAFIFSLFYCYTPDFLKEIFDLYTLIWICIGIVFHLIVLFLVAYLMAIKSFKAYGLFSIANNGLGLTIVGVVGLFKNYKYLFIALSTYHVLVAIALSIYLFISQKKRIRSFKLKFSRTSITELSQFLIISISIVVFGKIVDLLVRDYLIVKFDAYQTGLWQGVVKISDGYSTLFTAALGMLFFSKIASLIPDTAALKNFLWKSLASITLLSLIGLGIVFLFKSFFLRLFYNESFVRAAPLMDFQLLGDVFKFPSYLLAYLILAQLKTKVYILSQAITTAFYLILIFGLVPFMGIYAMPLAHFVRFVFYFALFFYLSRHILFANPRKLPKLDLSS